MSYPDLVKEKAIFSEADPVFNLHPKFEALLGHQVSFKSFLYCRHNE